MIRSVASRKRPLLILVLAFLFWFGLQFVNPVYAQPAQTTQSILVKFSTELSESERDLVIEDAGATPVRWLAPVNTAQIQITTSDRRAADAAVSSLHAHSGVLSVEYDWVIGGIPVDQRQLPSARSRQSTIPPVPPSISVNDPDFNDLQRVYAPHTIQTPAAWGFSMGAPEVTVAVVDSGINYEHPDLVGNILSGWDFVNDDADPTDDHGHGTHIAGIIAAKANNGIGSAGVCPNCRILPVKVLDGNNTGSWFGVAEGIIYAVDNGAHIINLSLGGTSDSQIVHDAVTYARENGVLVVAAAGNSRSDEPFYPAALDEVIAVSATRQDDTRWSLSNFGEWIDVAAPGFAIFSTYADLTNSYGGYTFMSGTSMASPHVAGLAGLLLSQNPERSADELRRLIIDTADDLGVVGRDSDFGHGRINSFRALALEAPMPRANAALSGTIWQDSNTNGQWEQDESAGSASLLIEVYDAASNALVGTSTVNSSGDWLVSDLFPGTYHVRAEPRGRVMLTSVGERTVPLNESQVASGINFGTAPLTEPADHIAFQIFIPGIIK